MSKHRRGAQDLVMRPVDSLKPYARNPRTHSDAQIQQIVNSIKRFGFTNPILLDGKNVIIAGHGRLRAAILMGMKTVPCVDLHGLTAAEKRAYIIADNQLALNAGWDMQLLAAEIEGITQEGIDVSLLGFSDSELAAIESVGVNAGEMKDAEIDIDQASKLNKKWKVRPGDQWRIGAHYLLCGDASRSEDVARLDAVGMPLLMVTDPPYGVSYDPTWRAKAGVNKNTGKMGAVANDDVADWSAAWLLFLGDVAYVYHAGRMASTVQASLEAAGFVIRAQIIWAKDRMALSRGDYHWQHEPVWYAVRTGKPAARTDDRTQTTLWNIPARDDSGHGHGTQKPLECMARPIRNHTIDAVYDPFIGSGTTMVACENLGRKCRGIEINPDYCAVTLERMQTAFPSIGINRVKS